VIFKRIFSLLALSTFSTSLYAAWSLEPSYYLRAERNDNIYLSADEANTLAVTGGAFSPRLAVIMEEETQKFTGDVDLSFTRYQDHEELNRDEGKLGLDWRKGTELSLFSVTGEYSSQSSLDPNLDVSGITDQQVDVLTTSVNPSWQYQFAERWAMILNMSYSDVEYDEPGIEGFSNFKVVNFLNYTNQSAGITFIHNFSEQDDISLSYTRSKYSGEGTGLQSDGVICGDTFSCLLGGFFPPYNYVAQASERKLNYDYTVWQLGYEHRFDEVSNLSFQAGRSETAVDNQTRAHLFDISMNEIAVGSWGRIQIDQSTSVYSLSYKQKSEISALEFSVGRNRVASSTGGLDETDTAKVYYSGGITERMSWAMDINREYRKPDENTNTVTVSKYTRTNITPSIFYKLDQDWSMSLGYMYSERDADSSVDSAKSNAVFFTMSWRDPQFVSTN
jgi:hypothetical protein